MSKLPLGSSFVQKSTTLYQGHTQGLSKGMFLINPPTRFGNIIIESTNVPPHGHEHTYLYILIIISCTMTIQIIVFIDKAYFDIWYHVINISIQEIDFQREIKYLVISLDDRLYHYTCQKWQHQNFEVN